VGLPEGVRQVIGRRVSRLSEDCRRVLAIASVVGRDFTFGILQAVADLSEDRLLDVIDEGQSARVIQNAPGSADGYTFTHALIRETLYGDLTAARRVRLHRKVAEALEQTMKPGREPLADLAYHYGQAASSGEVEKAVAYAVRAGEAAAARFAVEEAARFNRMALQSLDLLTDDATVRARRFDLHVKSGKAFSSVGQWGAATAEYQAALLLLPEDQRERRAEVLVDLSIAAFWLLNLDGLRAFANEAVAIADAVGRDDLWANAMACVASAETADGQVLQAVERDRRAIERAGGVPTLTMARSAVSLYHAGLTQESILRANQALESAQAAKEPAFIVYSLSQVGLASAGAGKYSEAQRAFDEARSYGRRYGVLPLLARAISMSTGMHVALGNLLPAETLANEARELARQVAFAPAVISAGVDLLFIYLRRGEIGRAEGLIDEVSRAAGAAGGWHGWLWALRLLQVRAELALARGDYTAAAETAHKCVIESRSRHRLKYEALASITHGRALFKLGETSSAIEDAARSVTLARRLGDPPILIEALSALLQIDGNDALLAEACLSIESVRNNLSDEVLRTRFLESETIRSIMKR
jgi:tetratricopeptide (TPR) repeat protein